MSKPSKREKALALLFQAMAEEHPGPFVIQFDRKQDPDQLTVEGLIVALSKCPPGYLTESEGCDCLGPCLSADPCDQTQTVILSRSKPVHTVALPPPPPPPPVPLPPEWKAEVERLRGLWKKQGP